MTDATERQLELAVLRNHRELFRLNAEALGGELREDGAMAYSYEGPDRQAMVTLLDGSDDDGPAVRAGLDKMMEFYRARVPKGIGCWSLDPPRPGGIGAMLLARGFQPGWRPCWMAMDLNSMQTGHPRPAGLQVVADNGASVDHVKDLPYGGDNGAVSRALMKALPGSVQQFIAILKDKIVGHCCLFLNEGEYGVAGLYNVAVLPAAREQGIGKALVAAACQLAHERGWRYAVLNATGRRMYEQVGFRWIGDGHTWWIVRPEVFGREAPGTREVALAEAVGLGDIGTLERIVEGEPEDAPIALHGLLAEDELDRPLANGLTLLQLAMQCQQAATAEWLVEHGASYTVLEAWDLGWKEKAKALLAARPSLVNFQYGQGLTTLLHIAADRNDMDLARLALSAGPDLGIKDKFNKSTPLDWAKYFHREEIIALIAGQRV